VVLSTALGLAAFGRPGRTNPLLRGFILPAATAPIAVLVVVTAVGPNALLTRYVAVAAPLMLVALGAVMALMKPRQGLALAGVAGLCAVVDSVLAHTSQGLYADTRAATQTIAQNSRRGDAVLLSGNATIAGGFQYYAEKAGLTGKVNTASPDRPNRLGFVRRDRSLWLWLDPPPRLTRVDRQLGAVNMRRSGVWRFEANEDLLLVRADRR